MSLRNPSILLFILALLVLNACGTAPGPRETRTSTEDGTVSDFETRPDPGKPGYELPGEVSPGRLQAIEKRVVAMESYDPVSALEVLRSLEPIPSGRLAMMVETGLYDPLFSEWLELALLVRKTLTGGEPVARAASQWANFHYGHMVTQARFPGLVASYGALFEPPGHVAVLLPDAGSLAVASMAIRDGILGAYLEEPGVSTLQFYPSGESIESARAAYDRAVDDGATFVIGPLRIESTRALSHEGNLPVPLLLLNEPAAGVQPSPVVSSLSLSQTEEAIAVANRALAQGYERALVLVPDDRWGERMESAFQTTFEGQQGYIAAASRFSRVSHNHAEKLTQMLKIEESNERKTQLQFLLGVPLTFEASHREDFDFIFMATNPEEGRELKPLLRFHDVDDVPVFSMSRVFSGQVARDADQDLDDIIFPTTSWQLRASSEPVVMPSSVRNGSLGNLYALGRDAWQVLRWLPLMQRDPDLWFVGDTGRLKLQANGRLFREPAWATFSGGKPTGLKWSMHN
jgi:outer membrane PBP1 activator LpoA protein